MKHLLFSDSIRRFIMRCPKCKSYNTKIVDTRIDYDKNVRKRRHVCSQCRNKFNTYEISEEQYLQNDNLYVIDLNEIRTAFNSFIKRLTNEV